MARIEIEGPDGPEEVHLNRAEESMDDRLGYSPPSKRETPWWMQYLLWLGAGILMAAVVGSGYFTPEKPWPDWLCAVVISGGIFALLYFRNGRQREK